QIEVTFEVDANGILQVAAEDKGTGKAEKITITAEKGRLSQDEIDRMVADAEEHAEEDKRIRARVDGRHAYEGYVYQLKHSIEDDDSKLTEAIEAEAKESLLEAIQEAMDWLDEHPEADVDELATAKAGLQKLADPIIAKAYQGSAGSSYDDDHDEL
ncbi:hypothetical protein As57867_001920, partial [Aphanomyces stellatus]